MSRHWAQKSNFFFFFACALGAFPSKSCKNVIATFTTPLWWTRFPLDLNFKTSTVICQNIYKLLMIPEDNNRHTLHPTPTWESVRISSKTRCFSPPLEQKSLFQRVTRVYLAVSARISSGSCCFCEHLEQNSLFQCASRADFADSVCISLFQRTSRAELVVSAHISSGSRCFCAHIEQNSLLQRTCPADHAVSERISNRTRCFSAHL
jgi:hypothetical protein